MSKHVNKIKLAKNAFSLIELMTVVTIIAIISSLAFPSYIDMRISAGRMEAKSNLNHIHTLAQVFFDENNRHPNYISVGTYSYSGGSYFDDSQDYGYGDNIGFKVTTPDKLRYYYSAYESTWDSYNQTSTSPERHFQIDAYTYIDAGWSEGAGLGIPTSRCQWGSYYDYWVMNHNRQMGLYGAGSTNGPDSWADAKQQCN